MQSACAWASIYSEADDCACCVAQCRIAKPLASRHAAILPFIEVGSLSFCVVVFKCAIRCTSVKLSKDHRVLLI